MEAEVTREAGRHIPFPMEDVVIDFEPMHLSAVDPSKVDVLLVACRVEHVAQRLKAAELAGLGLDVVDVESHGAHHAVVQTAGSSTPVALADIGGATTTVMLVNGDSAVTREEPFGLFADSSGGGAADSPPPGRAIDASAVDSLLALLTRLLRLVLLASHLESVDRLLLAGGGAAIAGLADRRGGASWNRRRDRRCLPRHGGPGANRPENPRRTRTRVVHRLRIGGSWIRRDPNMIARINLLPWRQRRRDRQRRTFLAQLGIVFAGSASLVFVTAWVLDARIASQDARNRFLRSGLGELERQADAIEVIRRRTDETLGRLQAIRDLRRDRTGTVRTLEALARTVTPGVHYTSLAKRGTKITAHGVAPLQQRRFGPDARPRGIRAVRGTETQGHRGDPHQR